MAPTPSPPQRTSLLRKLLTARGRSLEITKAGWLFITLTILVGFAAINSGSNLLHILFGAQIGLVVMSGVLSEFVVKNARVSLKLGGRVHAGTDASLQVQITNQHARYPILAVSIEADDQRPHDGKIEAVVAFAVEPGETSNERSRVRCPQRGRHPLPPAVVATRFPFGLFVKRKFLPESQLVTVFPALVERASPHAPAFTADAQGAHILLRRGRSGDIYELREHRESDPSSVINWPASARLASLIVCEYEDNNQSSLILSLRRGRGGEEDFEHAVSVTGTAIVAEMRDRGIDVGLRYGDELVFPPSSGRSHEDAMLGFLSTVGLGAGA